MRSVTTVPALIWFLFLPAVAFARTWHISEDGSGDAPTIQAAIDSSRDGDVVLVEPGTCYENLDLLGKAIELRSASGPQVTTIDGSLGDNSVILCISGETNATLIKGFTITGGSGYPITISSRTGGGILCVDSCPTIEGNIIRDNSSIGESFDSRGGGISFGGPNQCRIIIRNNLIEENVAKSNGGGINIAGPCLIEGNVIRRNITLGGDGGGVYNLTAQGVQIAGNLFLENEAADHGGAIYCVISSGAAAEVWVEDNIMVGNIAKGIAGVSDCSGGAIYLGRAGATVKRNTIAFNSGFAAQTDAAGGVCLFFTFSDVLVEENIVFRNYQGGIRAIEPAGGTVRRNLIFGNGPSDLDIADGTSLIVEENLFTDPMFCVFGPETRGELAHTSPALHSPWGVIGAVDHGSCGNQIQTPVLPTSWGRLKALYR